MLHNLNIKYLFPYTDYVLESLSPHCYRHIEAQQADWRQIICSNTWCLRLVLLTLKHLNKHTQLHKHESFRSGSSHRET